MHRAVVYTRQSFDPQGEGLAVARQLEDCRRLAELRGWQIVAEYSDNDRSAAGKRPRPGFEAALGDITAGRASAIVAWNLDRLTRNRPDTVRLIETAQDAGATIAVARGSDLDMSTPAGRMTADLLAAVARNEIEVKSDRQRRANEQRAAQGLPPRGRRAFGYTEDGMRVIEAEASLIRRGYETILAGGSLRSVARTWNAAGARTTVGGTWRGDNVRTVLKNARNAGLRVHRGEIVGPGVWPPIVDEATYRATIATLSDPSRRLSKDRSIKWLLTRISRCGKCGAVMATGRTQHGQRTYQCQAFRHLAVKATPVDEYVTAVVLGRLAMPDAADLVAPPAGVDVTELRGRATALRARLDEAARMFADGTITGRQLTRINQDVSVQLDAVEGELAAAGKQNALARFVGIEDVEDVWAGMDVMERRAVVHALFESILIHSPGQGAKTFRPETVEFVWRT